MSVGPTAGGGGGGAAVLEDPTGRRARWLRRAGRVVFVLFLAWLLATVLGGLGLIPATGIPFARVLRPSQGPPALVKLPRPAQPPASDLRPAVPAKVFAAGAGRSGRPGRSATAPGRTKTNPSAGAPHGKATAPGQTKTSPSAAVPHGRSTTAPGQAKKTSTATVTTKKP